MIIDDIYTNTKNFQLKKENIGKKIFNILREYIIKGNLKEGDILKISELSKIFNVSRSPLRDAIQILEREGWVRRQINGSVVVSEISLRQLKNLYAVRSVLEGLLTKQATLNLDAKNAKILERYYDNLINVVNSKVNSKVSLSDPDFLLMGKEFHSLIDKMANNRLCSELLSDINNKIERFRKYSVSIHRRRENSTSEHLKILKLMLEKKSNDAEFAMKEHILNSSKEYIKYLEKI